MLSDSRSTVVMWNVRLRRSARELYVNAFTREVTDAALDAP
jgi:hypothetical protein